MSDSLSIIKSHYEDRITKTKKKYKKLKSEIIDLKNNENELKDYIKHCENTIQDLLTLRMFLRTSIEWIKTSVADNFPSYNSFLYTAVFSNFGMFITKSFLDFINESSNDDSGSNNSTKNFWIPYIVWAITGIFGWLLDMRVSKNNSIAKKLSIVREATFGAILPQTMRDVLENNIKISSLLSDSESNNNSIKYRLGTNEILGTQP